MNISNLQAYKQGFHSFTRQEQEGMQFLTIKTPQFINLQQSFGEWLRLLNFAPVTVKYAPRKALELFCWLEQNQITTLSDITKPVVENYFEYLKSRRNMRKRGKLSRSSLKTHLTSLRTLARYLRETDRESFEVDIRLPGRSRNIKTIFSREEIKALYLACDSDPLGMRDSAMLAVYYGCGLRRNEGVNLDVNDLLFDKNLLFVRKGKNYKERSVPMTPAVKEDLQNYIDFARTILLRPSPKAAAGCEKKQTDALFLNSRGRRITSNMLAQRLQELKCKAQISKEAGLHALRHSIATHLLQSGMKLVQIKRFLGHSSLESTQIYTHVSCDLSAETSVKAETMKEDEL